MHVDTARLDVESVEGVRIAHPLTAISTIYQRNELRTPILIIVYDTAGGPTKIISDKATRVERGIIIDRSIAVKYDLSPGDTMTISDFEFTVSGISANMKDI